MDLNDLSVYKQTQNNFTEFKPTNGAATSNSNLQPIAPPLPPRPNNRNFGYSPAINPLFSSYGTNNYFNGYNGYSAYSNPFNSYSNLNQPATGFLRTAEENSRNAFQSIESVVQAFSAVSAMFESTFHAVYNSFRAVVGVADQFYRLKTNLSNIISAFALFRALKYLYRKLLRILRLQKADQTDDLWNKVSKLSDAESLVKDAKRQTNWPLIMFLAVVLGGPWLIWKILSSIDGASKDDNLWMSGKIDHFVGVAEYDFDAENNDELSFRRGSRIIIAPKEFQPKIRGWLLGTVDGTQSGIIPANYIKILGKKVVQNQGASTTSPTTVLPNQMNRSVSPKNLTNLSTLPQLPVRTPRTSANNNTASYSIDDLFNQS